MVKKLKMAAVWLQNRIMSSCENSQIEIAAHPKSGVTWMTFLVGSYQADRALTFNDISRYVPEIENQRCRLAVVEGPRFVKTHKLYDGANKKAIYVVRDARDVLVSLFHFNKKIGKIPEDMGFPEYFDYYFNRIDSGAPSWSDHVTSWIESDGCDIHLVKYEDMLGDAEGGLSAVLEFAGIDIERDRLTRAVNNSSFKNMQDMEKKKDFSDVTEDEIEENLLFVRKGKSGQWVEYRDLPQLKRFVLQNKNVMEKLGYL